MGPFEYLLLFVAVVLGLGVADLAVSINRLLRAGAKVRWDWLAPLAALVALVKIITQWWAWYGQKGFAGGITFELFLWIVAMTLLLFLLASAALPDETPEDGIDLRAYFERTGRYYFILFALHMLATVLFSVWADLQINRWLDPVLLGNLPVRVGAIAVAASGAVIRRRWWQGLCLVAFLGVYLWQSAGTTLAG